MGVTTIFRTLMTLETGGASVVPARTGSLVPAESGSLVPAAVPSLRSYYMAFNKDVNFFHGPRTAFSVLEQAKQGALCSSRSER